MDKKQNSSVTKIIKAIMIVIIIVMIIAIIRNLVIIIDYKIKEKDNNQVTGLNIKYKPSIDTTDSVQVAQAVEKAQQQQMIQAGISETLLDTVVIKDGNIYNYNQLNEFYNTYGDSMYYGDTTRTIQKVVNYVKVDDDREYVQEELSLIVDIKTEGIERKESTLDVLDGDILFGFDYAQNPIKRRLDVIDDEEYITWYVLVDSNMHDLFSYRLSSTPYNTNYDFVYTPSQSEYKVYSNSNGEQIYDFLNIVTVISHEISGDKTYQLDEFIDSEHITRDDIKSNCLYDASFGKCSYEYYKDGGSYVFTYNDFCIYVPVRIIAEDISQEEKEEADKINKSVVFAPVNSNLDDIEERIINFDN